jgi:hypothetical protein
VVACRRQLAVRLLATKARRAACTTRGARPGRARNAVLHEGGGRGPLSPCTIRRRRSLPSPPSPEQANCPFFAASWQCASRRRRRAVPLAPRVEHAPGVLGTRYCTTAVGMWTAFVFPCAIVGERRPSLSLGNARGMRSPLPPSSHTSLLGAPPALPARVV